MTYLASSVTYSSQYPVASSPQLELVSTSEVEVKAAMEGPYNPSDTDPVVVSVGGSVGGSVGAAVVTVVGAAVDGEGLLPPPPRRANAVASIRKRQRNVFMAFLILTVPMYSALI